jgi:prophage maintenance system killer protein
MCLCELFKPVSYLFIMSLQRKVYPSSINLFHSFNKHIKSLFKKKALFYLDLDYFCSLNKLAINLFGMKKGDKYEVRSYIKLLCVENKYISAEGDFYDKATMLLCGLVRAHAFASANRRTALLAVITFAYLNYKKVYIPDNPSNSNILIGIREDYYVFSEIKEWIKSGKIKEFKRF